ncbi:MAG: proteasome accessory factor PafA2 [Nitrospirae bacterium]|nr:proteasome accessory factor PafA2 [Nitrospirota bacterium]
MKTRIVGTETEYGIVALDDVSSDPVSNSLSVVGSCPLLPATHILWDYENENPLNDARGFEIDGEKERPGPDYNRLLNKLMFNGGRLYVDGAHPEFSTPECLTPREVVAYEKAGERILELSRETSNRTHRKERRIVLYKNNTDGKGNSYGYHENYLVERKIPFDRLLTELVPFLVTRQIYTGAGKVGSENHSDPVPYQISQRADFFEVLVDLNTMVKRPIMNTRDEPHSDPSRYRRLHVIVGDSNMSEICIYLKVGTLLTILSVIEEESEEFGMSLENPVKAIKNISRDLTLKEKIRLKDGREMTAIQIQRVYLERAKNLFRGESQGYAKEVIDKWGIVLDQLEEDPSLLSKEIDWLIKKEMIDSYIEKKKCDWNDPRVSLLDLQYHDISQEKGIYYALERGGFVNRLLTEEEIIRAMEMPPEGTRAYFRGTCLKKFPKEIYSASWTSVLFDVGNAEIKKIPLMDPFRGTRPLVEKIMNSSHTAKELLGYLAQNS